jgi:hypothetical protein
MGREIKEKRTIDGATYQTDKKYDLAGRLEYIIYPDTGRTRYNYQYNVGRHGCYLPNFYHVRQGKLGVSCEVRVLAG